MTPSGGCSSSRFAWRHGYKEIKERQVWPVVKSWLSAAQQEMLDKFAPERVGLPSGKKWKISYAPKAAPVIAARIQELYGVEGSLTIAAGLCRW